MLRRACISLGTALIAAVWGFTDLFPVTGIAGQVLFYTATGFLVLSLLFSLFEEAPIRPDEEPAQRLNEQPLTLEAEHSHAHV